MRIKAETLDRRVRIERPIANDALGAAGKEIWAEVGEVWASVQDMLPSRGERLADGLNVATRPARVRMRYRSDVTASMRLIALKWDQAEDKWVPAGRVMQIISVPAEIGRRDGLELMVEDFSTQPAVA